MLSSSLCLSYDFSSTTFLIWCDEQPPYAVIVQLLYCYNKSRQYILFYIMTLVYTKKGGNKT